MATCNLNVIVVLEFISRDLYLLFAKLFSSKGFLREGFVFMQTETNKPINMPLTMWFRLIKPHQ